MRVRVVRRPEVQGQVPRHLPAIYHPSLMFQDYESSTSHLICSQYPPWLAHEGIHGLQLEGGVTPSTDRAAHECHCLTYDSSKQALVVWFEHHNIISWYLPT